MDYTIYTGVAIYTQKKFEAIKSGAMYHGKKESQNAPDCRKSHEILKKIPRGKGPRTPLLSLRALRAIYTGVAIYAQKKFEGITRQRRFEESSLHAI